KLLLSVVGVFALLGTGVHFLHGYQIKRNASDLLSYAERAEQEGDLGRAIDFWSRYLGFVPGDLAVLDKRGMSIAKTAQDGTQFAGAYEDLDIVVRRSPERHAVRREAARLATMLGHFNEAKDHLEQLLNLPPPNKPPFPQNTDMAE